MNEWGREGEGDMYNDATVAEKIRVSEFLKRVVHM